MPSALVVLRLQTMYYVKYNDVLSARKIRLCVRNKLNILRFVVNIESITLIEFEGTSNTMETIFDHLSLIVNGN